MFMVRTLGETLQEMIAAEQSTAGPLQDGWAASVEPGSVTAASSVIDEAVEMFESAFRAEYRKLIAKVRLSMRAYVRSH